MDVNQLTSDINDAIAGLQAHQTAGVNITHIELGNEMYDSTRADVVAEYPQPSDYGAKMANWIPKLKAAFPDAQVSNALTIWGNKPYSFILILRRNHMNAKSVLNLLIDFLYNIPLCNW